MTETATEKQTYTCTIRLIMPVAAGDQVIKVYPSDHKSERIDLGINDGKERWKVVQRLFQNHVPRGDAIPDPVSFHNGSDLKTIVIEDSDIPVIRLEGAIFEKPEPGKYNPRVVQVDWEEHRGEMIAPNSAPLPYEQMASQIKNLETTVANLAALVEKVVSTGIEKAEKRGPGRPRTKE